MIHAGRAGHVTGHPAKDDHPANTGMAGSGGMDCHHNHPTDGYNQEIDRIAIDIVIRI